MDKQGRIPSIGDNDDAWVVRLNDQPGDNNYQSVINTAAAWLENSDLKKSDLEFDEKSWWLLGEEGRRAFEKLPVSEKRGSTNILRMGGYGVMESASSKVVMDFGSLGYGTMAAHGHADSLGIWANLDGEELLVDSGTFAYQEGGEWRSYFRSTRAHNTVCVDNLDQSEMLGPFLWGKKANTRLIHWDSQNNHSQIIAEHNGYKNLGIIHRRSVLFFHPSILAICDSISGSGIHEIEQNWHLNPKSIIEISNNIALIRTGKICFQFEVLTTSLNNLLVYSGQMNPIQGWVSKNYGVKEPSPVLSCFGNSQLPAQIVSIFYIKDANEKAISDAKITIHNIFYKGVPG
jgi:hypothetical protein